MGHDIFLSYSRQDTDLMRRLRDDLRATGLTVWTDEGIEPGSPSWKIVIEDAIRDTRCLIVIFSPGAKASRWVRAELDYAEAQHKPVFAVIGAGNEADSVPFGYSSHQWIDLRTPADYDTNFRRLTAKLLNNMGGETAQTAPVVTPAPGRSGSGIARPRPHWLLVGLMLVGLLAGGVVLFAALSSSGEPVQQESLTDAPEVPAASDTSITQTSDDVITIAPYTPPDTWQRHETASLHITAPRSWAAIPTDNPIFAAFAGSIFPDFDPAQGLPQLPGVEFHLYLGDLVGLRGLFLSREDLGVTLPLDALAVRYSDVTKALNYGILRSDRVLLPGGEAIRLHIDTSTGIAEGEGYTYILTHNRQGFLFIFTAATASASGFFELTEQIMATFGFENGG
jgi:hypothetical protein